MKTKNPTTRKCGCTSKRVTRVSISRCKKHDKQLDEVSDLLAILEVDLKVKEIAAFLVDCRKYRKQFERYGFDLNVVEQFEVEFTRFLSHLRKFDAEMGKVYSALEKLHSDIWEGHYEQG